MATVYINGSTGNNSNTYVQAQSPSTPWLNLANVNGSATEGDTIILMPGTVILAAGITFTKNFTIQGQTTASACILDSQDTARQIQLNTSGKTIAWSNINFYRFKDTTNAPCIVSTSTTGSTQTFTDCIISGFTSTTTTNDLGGFVNDNGSTTQTYTFTRCVFRNYTQTTTGCWIIGSRGQGTNTTNSLNLYNCVFYDATTGASCMDNYINSGNTAPGCGVRVKNCIFDAHGDSIKWDAKSRTTLTQALNSVQYNMTTNFTGTALLTSDPLLVDPANLNYNLRPSSPAIDAGTNS